MPFRSESQRKYLWKFEPEVAEKWAHMKGAKNSKKQGLPEHVKKHDLVASYSWHPFGGGGGGAKPFFMSLNEKRFKEHGFDSMNTESNSKTLLGNDTGDMWDESK